MMTITPYGAAGEVTGSCWLVDVGPLSHHGFGRARGERVLVDCGLFQGEHDAVARNHEPFAFAPASVQAVVLTHAHLDHCGRLPRLVREGFRGRIYATPATRDLAEIVLRDTAAIAVHEQGRRADAPPPLFTDADVDRCVERFEPIEYHQLTPITDHVELHLVDAGHILGAASAVLHVGGERIAFSGDIGNPGSAIVRDPQPIDEASVVVMEATYGNRRHGRARMHDHPSEAPITGAKRGHIQEGLDEFIAAVAAAVHRGGAVLIPAFSIERTQELLYAFHEWRIDQQLNHVPVFLDGPMAIKATEVFRRYPRYYDAEAAALRRAGSDFFRFPMLHQTPTPEASKAIRHAPNPKIIIAGAGMLTGGRIRHHLRNYLGDPRTTVIVVGYQAQGTLGRLLVDGARQVQIDDEPVNVRATFVVLHSLSAHADRNDLLDWLKKIRGVKQLILGHADDDARTAFARTVRNELHLSAAEPRFGQPIHLESIGERLPVAPPAVTEPNEASVMFSGHLEAQSREIPTV